MSVWLLVVSSRQGSFHPKLRLRYIHYGGAVHSSWRCIGTKPWVASSTIASRRTALCLARGWWWRGYTVSGYASRSDHLIWEPRRIGLWIECQFPISFYFCGLCSRQASCSFLTSTRHHVCSLHQWLLSSDSLSSLWPSIAYPLLGIMSSDETAERSGFELW